MKKVFLLLIFLTAFMSQAEEVETKTLPIHEAAEKGDLDIVSKLLKENPKLAYKYNEHGNQIIHIACKFNHIKLLTFLLDSGIPIESKSDYLKNTPLNMAATFSDVKMVDLLLKRGADINYQSGFQEDYMKYKSGNTALLAAAILGDMNMVRYLVEKGAKVNIISCGNSNDPKTALDYAKREEMIELLKKHGAKKGSELVMEQKK